MEYFEKALEVVEVLRPDGTKEFKDRVRVVLKETATDFLIHFKGCMMLDDGSKFAEDIKKKTENYLKVSFIFSRLCRRRRR